MIDGVKHIARIAVVVLLWVGIAVAQSDKAIEAQRTKIATLERDIKQSENKVSQLRRNRSSREGEVRALAAQVQQRSRLLNEQQKQVGLLNDDINQCDKNIDSLEVLFSKEREAYASMVRDAYRSYRQNSILSYIFTSEDFVDLSRRLVYVRSVAKIRTERIERIREITLDIEEQRTQLKSSSDELSATIEEVSRQKSSLESDISSAKASISQMSRQEREELSASQLKQKQLDSAIAELQKLVKNNTQGASFSAKTSNLNLPIVGGRVKRYMDNMAEVVGAKGAKVISIYDGKVVEVKQNRITGNYDIYVAHGEYISSYAGLSAVSVDKGQNITRNTTIGLIGASIDLATMNSEYKIVFGIYPPSTSTKMKASDCFKR